MIAQRHVEMEVALHRRDNLGWSMEVRVTDPANAAPTTREGRFDVDLGQLQDLEHQLLVEPDAYADYLTGQFFADDAASAGFAEARRAAASTGEPMRMRLRIGPSAPDLHGLRWELLRDPDSPDSSLMTQETVVFSRYLDSRDYRRVEVRPDQAAHAIVAVSAPTPTSLADFAVDGRSFDPVDGAGELERAAKALAGSEVVTIGDSEPLTLARLIDALKAGTDILYLVCHGYVKTRGEDRGPRLLLQNEDGSAALVHGHDLVNRLRELIELPRLVVLASCMSSKMTSSDDGALAAIGPQVAAIGVPAVIAMQDEVSMETVEAMMPKFFTELRHNPEIDLAFATARGHVRDRPDWWVPVLFMRLRSGRIWYSPSFAAAGVDIWPVLLKQIEWGKLTPIVGPGLTDSIFGTRREMAQAWARTHSFPISPPLDEDLPQVAQYIAKVHSDDYLRDNLRDFVGTRILRGYEARLRDEIGSERLEELRSDLVDAGALLEIVQAVGRIARKDVEYEGHKILAALPLPLYLTTEAGGLLADAIEGDGARIPVREFFQWTDREGIDWGPPSLDDPAKKRGTKEQPLVYSLFGDLGMHGSVVLSEDDYFEFLTNFSSENKQKVPSQVVRALVDTSLLFVGFRIDDWDFRVLFSAIMSLGGRDRRRKYPHVAVQLDPEESSQHDPAKVRSYFESYFGQAFTIYWGDSSSFLKELATKRQAVPR